MAESTFEDSNSTNESPLTFETANQNKIEDATRKKCNKQPSSSKSSSTNNISQKDDHGYLKYYDDDNIKESLVGRSVSSIDDGYNLYQAHSRALGFSIRKQTLRRRREDNSVFEFYLVCSKEGASKGSKAKEKKAEGSNDAQQIEIPLFEKTSKKRKTRSVNETRTGCKAMVRFKQDSPDADFVVLAHELQHNHELVIETERHHLKSERTITGEKGQLIESMVESGIRPMEAYNFLCNEAGCEEVVGHIKRDHLNYVTQYRMRMVEGKDMQSVLDVLQQRTEEDPSFFYRLKFGDLNNIVSYYWRDSMMLEDYKAYGDVVIFDTTYRTNKYGLICASFVGINCHWKTTMFACAFITNEKEESFEWLLETFKRSMCQKEPKTIFTDQDKAMSNAIEKVFPNLRHRLCLWHIEKNFVSHFGSLKSDEEFKNMFKNCLMGCHTEQEFEALWAKMMEKYGHQKEEWFNKVYDDRHKWCTTLNRDMFSAGILSLQRSEVTNRAISFNAKATTNLFEFYNIFEQTVKRWRSNEISDNFRNRSERPKAIKSKSRLLRHAAEVYTLSLFNDFQTEYEWAMASSLRSFEQELSDLKLFEVSSEEDFSNSHKVAYNESTTEFVCTCLCFSETGMLCFHIIRVMHMYSIFKIPERYIVKRWTRLAKSTIWENSQSERETNPYANLWTPWRHAITKNFYNLVSICQANEEARKLCDDSLKELYKNVKELFKTDEEKQKEIEDEERRREVVQNPEVIKTKGRPPHANRRIKGHFEKRKMKTRHPNEYGTKTPNVDVN